MVEKDSVRNPCGDRTGLYRKCVHIGILVIL
jgi:hypothetical protein